MGKQLNVAVVTVSTRCSLGSAKDESGPVLCELVSGRNWKVAASVTVTDSREAIEQALRSLIADSSKIDVILTTGGTGISPDDKTPEATRAVLDCELPGLVSGMFTASFQETPFAMLSRAVAGVARKTVIVNMPGSVRAVRTCFSTIAVVLEHAVSLVTNRTEEVAHTHAHLTSNKASTGSLVTNKMDEVAKTQAKEHHLEHHMEHRLHIHHHHHQLQQHQQQQQQHEHHHNHHHHSCDDGNTERRRHGEERPRESAYPTVTVEKALDLVLEHCRPLEIEEIMLPCCTLPLEKSITSVTDTSSLHFRRIAKDLYALGPVPAFRASVKDGYAVRSEDGCMQRQVIGRSDAGLSYSGDVILPGFAVAINTGAKVPDSADAVVQIEDTRFISGKSTSNGLDILETIDVLVAPKLDQDIRPIGFDLHIGEKLASAGDRLQPAAVALLLSGGYSIVPVVKQPVIAVFSTGSELSCDSILGRDGLVRDSNRPMLLQLLASHGFSCVDCGIAKDSVEDHRLKFNAALGIANVSVIITTGGVSMGDCDFVKDVLLRDFGATIHFGRVFVKPGKPTVFATIKRKDADKTVLVFSLPGNPVSALAMAHLFVLPALRRLAGASAHALLPMFYARLEHDFELDSRPEYHRVILSCDPVNGIMLAKSTGPMKQASSRIASAAVAGNDTSCLMLALLALPPRNNERRIATAGSVLPAYPLTPL